MSYSTDDKEQVKEWLNRNASTSAQKLVECNEGKASQLCNLCIESLKLWKTCLIRKSQHEETHDIFQEVLMRLQLWRDSFGPGELYEVLDRSKKMQNVVFGHLVAIGFLLRGRLLLLAATSNQDDVAITLKDIEILIEEAHLVSRVDSSDSEDEFGDQDEDSTQDVPQKGDQRAIEDIQHHVNLLMNLLPSLQHFVEFIKDEGEKTANEWQIKQRFTASPAASAYINIAREKFPAAKSILVERLGEANWERHLRVREMMLKEGEHEEIAKEEHTVEKSIFRPISTFQDSGLGTSIPTKSAYAATVASHSSFRTSATEGGKGARRVPEPPQEMLLGEPFRCPICTETLEGIKNRYQWKVHVYADLEAYICTFEECQYSLATFPSREAWAAHETYLHRSAKTWGCTECPLEFPMRDVLEHHLKVEHPNPFSGSLLAVEKPQERECPLCLKVSIGKERDFVSHLGKHMEAIALSALPKDSESESESEGNQTIGPVNVIDLTSSSDADSHIRCEDLGDVDVPVGNDSDIEYTPSSTRTRKHPQKPKDPNVQIAGSRSSKTRPNNAKLVCKQCDAPPFKNALALSRHVASTHTRAFTCVFNFAGCPSTFARKGEWKRHVSSQHLNLNAWYCELGSCGKVIESIEFSRKDLFTQHLRRMHAPPSVKHKKVVVVDHLWEKEVKSLQVSCLKVKRQSPKQLRCPAQECGILFAGPNCWDEKMEHVGKHLEQAAHADPHLVVDHSKDDLLLEWAVREGIIKKSPTGGYRFASPM